MTDINNKTAAIMESITELGMELKERSQNGCNHQFISESVDSINHAIAVLIELSDG